MKNMYLRYDQNKYCFKITADKKTPIDEIVKFFKEYFPRYEKKMKNFMYLYNNQTYFYGKHYYLDELSDELGLKNELRNLEDLYKAEKDNFLAFIKERVVFHKEKLGIDTDYKIKVAKKNTNLGWNCIEDKTLSFNLRLMHYDKEVIDIIVIHELIHHFHKKHDKKFYDTLYAYAPNYEEIHNRLEEGFTYEESNN